MALLAALLTLGGPGNIFRVGKAKPVIVKVFFFP
jgi:hypothetical protein